MASYRIIVMFLVVLAGGVANGQERYVNFIRGYNQSLVISLDGKASNQSIVGDFGGVVNAGLSSDMGRYVFQAQELDIELSLYLFPDRTYCSKTKRFLQVDPKSQYYSPYLFVENDPINRVDRDGKEGRPLVLYEEVHEGSESFNESLADILDELPDAYHVPLSDFVNREVADIPDWNGRVFITGHSSAYVGHELEVERAEDVMKLKVEAEEANVLLDKASSRASTTIGGRDLGRMLREFSHERGVDVKSVVAGGCEGRYAADEIGRGYSEIPSNGRAKELTTIGLDEDRYPLVAGKRVTSADGDIGLKRTRFHVERSNTRLAKNTSKKLYGGKRKFLNYKNYIGKGQYENLPYAEGGEISSLAEGRIPSALENDFVKFVYKY